MIFDNERYLIVLVRRTYLVLIGIIVFFIFLSLFFAGKWQGAVRELNQVIKQSQRQVYIVEHGGTWVARAGTITTAFRLEEIRLFIQGLVQKLFANNAGSLDSNLEEVLKLMSFDKARFLYQFVPEADRYTKEDAYSEVTIEKLYVDGEKEVDGVDKKVLEATEDSKETKKILGQDGIYEGTIQFLVDVYTPLSNSSKKRKESQQLAFYFELIDTKRTPGNPYGLYVQNILTATPEKIK